MLRGSTSPKKNSTQRTDISTGVHSQLSLNGELQGRRQVLATNTLPFTLQLAVEWTLEQGFPGFAAARVAGRGPADEAVGYPLLRSPVARPFSVSWMPRATNSAT